MPGLVEDFYDACHDVCDFYGDNDADYGDGENDEEINEIVDTQVKSLVTVRTTLTAPWNSSFLYRLTKFRYLLSLTLFKPAFFG